MGFVRWAMAVAACGILAIGCAGGGGGAAQSAPAEAAMELTGDIAKIEPGMSDTDVRNILGNPTSSNAYITGKSFIPFYFGTDTARTDWVYEGQGRVVFSRNAYSGALKVIRVLPQ